MKTPTCPDCGTKMVCFCPACKGRAGGKASGPTKARSSKAASAAVKTRWDRYYQTHPRPEKKALKSRK